MHGSWFAFTFGGLVVLAAVIGMSILASPLIGVVIGLLVVAVLAGLFVAGRAGREASGTGAGEGPAGRSSFRGGPGPMPRSGGAPASGEGEAKAGEAAGTDLTTPP